ncbi:kinesin family member 4/21/27 [Fistulifera solaris]|uniref:Kinesin family member 4/21/27 n=1 Tax=Fistulifera solaris TaxID=1519565 RepID=A0A1Z5JY97_FISSO|nr:kinesin family member 4/21/27 [Fistulifera solaris]|eukprot:GAX18997.1 kinesin family member 4/21/27 [Fistulifera solaris]
MIEDTVESDVEADEDETVSKDVEKGPLDTSSCVQVAVRVRPLLALEAGSDRCLDVFQQSVQVGGQSGPLLTFDRVFDSHTEQSAIFTDCGMSLVESCLQGYNATILAYGQTGSGKTFTMMGPDDQALLAADGNQHQSGIIPRSLALLFQKLEENSSSSDYRVRLQFLEIYGEDIRDLLVPGNGGDKLTIRDLGGSHEPEVVGATQELVSSSSDALKCLSRGMLRRVTGATAMNESSSRSHAILSVLVEQSTKVVEETDGEERLIIKQSKFNFVDLAGSERIKRTQAEGQRMKEGIDINKGLLVLGNVISALGDPKKRGRTFVPYRDSKLTRLLKGSLGGNHKTLMIACVSPSEDNLEESLSCLRYANRAKNIQNNAVVNVDANTKLIAGLQSQVKSLSTALLKSIDGVDILAEGKYSRDVLQAWAQGDIDLDNAHEPGGSIPPSRPSNSPRKANFDGDNEIQALKAQLRRVQKHQEEAEEQLYAAKAEKELYLLQLSVVDENASLDRDNNPLAKTFLDKANVYEKEIGELRKSLHEANAKLNYMREAPEVPFSIEKAQRQAEAERHRLNMLSEKFSMDQTPQNPLPARDDNFEDSDYLSPASKKFIAEIDEEMEEDANIQGDNIQDDNLEAGGLTVVDECNEDDIRANLIDLSRGIAAKEELIDQLKFSEEKYANMREFYEEKVRQMESALSEKEAEREQLLLKLRNTHASDATSLASLRDLLKEKDKNIENLRKKHKQLVGLTSVSSRNQVQITRLQEDVKEMKRRKVLLQKQITRERRDHANEIKQLQKEAVKKDRELSRLQKVTADKENEARKAHLVSKSRLEELGQLRAKYRDSEKRLRVLSVKQGVMAKAGIDPVLVGRKSNVSRKTETQTSNNTGTEQNFIINGIRKYFDEKVEEIARKEAIADKLAQEWEAHFELSSQKATMKDLLPTSEEAQSLDLQIKFKEDRIRQLARRLGTVEASESRNGHTKTVDSFLNEEKFTNFFTGLDPKEAMQIVSKVLFGMIVKERRRVSALARAASSLDERLVAAEKEVSVRETAFKNYIREQDEEATAASLKKQEHILSLMDIVKEDSGANAPRDDTLLVLANERIASLEQQIIDLRSRESAVDSFREKINNLEHSLETKSHDYEELQLHLRQIQMGMKRLRDDLKENPGVSFSTSLAELEAVMCRPPLLESRRSFESSIKNTDMLPFSSHNTDDDSDLPEWASDIMADLAYIAEGKPPPSLERSISPNEQVARPTLYITPPPYSEDVSRNSPEGRGTDLGDIISSTMPPSTDKAGRKAMSREIADRLERIIIPGHDRVDKEADHRDPDEDVEKHQSVFERLVSPSQYTGTQREKYFSSRKKRQETADEAATRLLDHLLEGDDGAEASRHESAQHHSHSVYEDYTQLNVFERLQKTTTQAFAVKQTSNHQEVTTGGSYGGSTSNATPGQDDTRPSNNYTKLNVFERLQRTTTEAFSKKKNTKTKHEKR